ncbi:hypothetical protein GPECTOR_9g660 [Gonium pectorale]|uniref:tRNA:m(4)X modification enzyme TRM13 n=1 Tax=Gonium pectorale TaxID=33097 RepID=A0A150GRX8_GONPE|nr:hypothetical protein GPECTOR_9g660 [Gonium pectorale]|eukprot:KXZ52615.1 hypothetical protein GPECTOR_9g660 [Gonium pectorale]
MQAQPHFLEDANVGSDCEPDLPPPPPVMPQLPPTAATAEVVTAVPVPVPVPAASSLDAAAAAALHHGPLEGDPAGPLSSGNGSTGIAPTTGTGGCAGGHGGPGALTPAVVAAAPAPAGAGRGEAATAVPLTAAAAAAAPNGSDVGGGDPPPPALVTALGPFQKGRAAQRAALARSLGREAFLQLLSRVEAAYAAACGGAPPAPSVLRPPECEAMLSAPSEKRPFDLKHGLQQASIVGNMQRVGLLEPGPQGGAGVAVVELGAGKGYLGATVAGCCGVRRLVATDIKAGLKLKADRHLRHIQFARHRVDLKDYVPAATPELAATPAAPGSGAGSAAGSETVPWVAVAKHLCGAATDYGLRSVLLPPHAKRTAAAATAAAAASGGAAAGAGEAFGGAAGGGHVGSAPRGACPDEGDIASAASTQEGGGQAGGAEEGGLRSQAGKRPRREEGRGSDGSIGNGHKAASCAATGMSCAAAGDASSGGGGPAGLSSLRGLAIAPCCHHRCGWRAYVGKPLFRRLGLSPRDFELMSWMTGWALCGHDTPAGTAPAADGGRSDGSDGEGCDDGGCDDGGCNDPAVSLPTAADPAEEDPSPPSPCFDPAALLPRSRRMAVGQICKQVIDAGRLDWLRSRFRSAELVSYIGPEVTGENRLLLAAAPLGAAPDW